MSDEIRKVIADALDNLASRFELPSALWHNQASRNWCVNIFLNAFHAAGYTIEPEWSTDMNAAPRDGTPLLFYLPEYRPPFIVANCFGDTEKQFAASNNAETLHINDGAHWKPITPPKEAE